MTTTDTADSIATPGPGAWIRSESGFPGSDHARLFYRCWQPRDTRRSAAAPPLRVLVFLHSDHAHSGHLLPVVEPLLGLQDWAFAWDARGHGHSPGARDGAADVAGLVQDFHCFTRHLRQTHNLSTEDMLIVAHGVGAVIAATWIHDHAPRLRGVVMAAAAFQSKGFARFTAPARQRAGTARRIVANASAIEAPVLMLTADKDQVVRQAPQAQFFDRLGSRQKRFLVLQNGTHAVFHDQGRPLEDVLQTCRQFIDRCYGHPIPPADHHLDADQNSRSATQFRDLQRNTPGSVWARAVHTLQRHLLHRFGPLSDGLRIGLAQGFDSGASLEYVYRHEASGRLGIGKLIDRIYLDTLVWRGVRLRQQHLQRVLSDLIAVHPANLPLRILDVAAGGGRHVLETAKRFQDRPMQITLRDAVPANLDAARQLAASLALQHTIDYQCRDALALSPDSDSAGEPLCDIVVVSGLYELCSDNAPVLASLRAIQGQLRPGGHLVYTGQPWQPQWQAIARILIDHRGEPWQMRLRPQAELDALVSGIHCRKTQSLIGPGGLFTVSVARHEPPPAKPVAGS
ncbi:class I SAM-dependent methyltransferase family protein [Sphaerotilus sp.]|uniref:class I SAM-dependent methyltransferase family protein n=1 Tax=Sphaerotilus sp. TaxID=2093942 RepID=UPI0034E29477